MNEYTMKVIMPAVAIGVVAGIILSSKFNIGQSLSKLPLVGGLFA